MWLEYDIVECGDVTILFVFLFDDTPYFVVFRNICLAGGIDVFLARYYCTAIIINMKPDLKSTRKAQRYPSFICEMS